MPTTPEDITYAPTTWGQPGGNKGVDLTVPSGQKCLAIKHGVEALMELGLLEEVDQITGIVQMSHVNRVKGDKPKVDVQAIASDPAKIKKTIDTMNKVVVHAVVQPELTLDPDDESKIHISNVSLEDRSFIFQWVCGGSADIERFRQESSKHVAGMADEPKLPKKAKRAIRNS